MHVSVHRERPWLSDVFGYKNRVGRGLVAVVMSSWGQTQGPISSVDGYDLPPYFYDDHLGIEPPVTHQFPTGCSITFLMESHFCW